MIISSVFPSFSIFPFFKNRHCVHTDFIILRLRRSSVDHGLLIYRQDYEGTGTASNADIEKARLVAILGEKQLCNSWGYVFLVILHS